MWELGHKEGWVSKNWCFWIVVLEKTLESPLDSKEIKAVNPKRKSMLNAHWKDWCWTPILWPSDSKSWLIGKDSAAGKDWRREEKGTTEGEMVGRHHRLTGVELEQTPGVGDGQGGLARCRLCSRREADTTEQLSWTERLKKNLKVKNSLGGLSNRLDTTEENFNEIEDRLT